MASLNRVRVQNTTKEHGFVEMNEFEITLDFDNDRHHQITIKKNMTVRQIAGLFMELGYELDNDKRLK